MGAVLLCRLDRDKVLGDPFVAAVDHISALSDESTLQSGITLLGVLVFIRLLYLRITPSLHFFFGLICGEQDRQCFVSGVRLHLL